MTIDLRNLSPEVKKCINDIIAQNEHINTNNKAARLAITKILPYKKAYEETLEELEELKSDHKDLVYKIKMFFGFQKDLKGIIKADSLKKKSNDSRFLSKVLNLEN